ncbi:MBL fold metallo-hydrolase [Amycolatopsis sp. NPDC059090]|uniref:MBL fold metallo-hydrolase n=1 Tax=unclassified Amycolatopsis TaxID=2618356 RepID=UPI00366E2284
MTARRIAAATHWLGGCMQAMASDGPVHYHVSAYLISGSTHTVLIDTGDPRHWPLIEAQLDEALAGRSLDYLLPTHPELPHAGNLPALLARYPGAEVVGDVRDYHLHYPEYSHRLRPLAPGDRLDLGDRQLELAEAYIQDLPNTVWAYDPGDRVLYVSDGFSFVHDVPALPSMGDDEPGHRPGECRLLSTEMPAAPTVDQAAYGTGRALYWTRYVDVTDTFGKIGEFLATRPADLIAPAHGNVIADVPRMMKTALAAHRQVYDAYTSA